MPRKELLQVQNKLQEVYEKALEKEKNVIDNLPDEMSYNEAVANAMTLGFSYGVQEVVELVSKYLEKVKVEEQPKKIIQKKYMDIKQARNASKVNL